MSWLHGVAHWVSQCDNGYKLPHMRKTRFFDQYNQQYGVGSRCINFGLSPQFTPIFNVGATAPVRFLVCSMRYVPKSNLRAYIFF